MSQNWEELTDTKGNTYYRKRKIANGILEVALSPNEDRYIGSFISTDGKTSFDVTHYPQKPNKPFPPTYFGSFDCRKWTAQRYGILYTSHKMLGPNKTPMYTPENPMKPRVSTYTPKPKIPRIIGPIPKIPKVKPSVIKETRGAIPKIRKGPTLTEQAIAYGKLKEPLLVANGVPHINRKLKTKRDKTNDTSS